MDLGRIGVWVSPRALGAEQFGAAAKLAEAWGWSVLARRLAAAAQSFARCSRRPKIVVATSIVNIWAYEPAELAAEYAELAPRVRRATARRSRGRPSRGRPSDYSRPLSAMRDFLDGLDARAVVPLDRRAWRHSPRRCSTSVPSARSARTPTSSLSPTRAPPGATRPGPADRPRGRLRPRRGSRARPRHGARIRAHLPRPQQLHEQPDQARLRRGGHRRRRLRPADRRRDPPWFGREIAAVVDEHFDAGRGSRRAAGPRRAGDPAPGLDGLGRAHPEIASRAIGWYH